MTDVLPARSTANLGAAPATGDRYRLLTWTFASTAMVMLLTAPALWNGFPLIFPDTGGYVTRLIEGTLGMGRSALYGVFLYAGVPLSFWPNAMLQSALTVWLIVLTMRTHGLGGRPWLALGVVAMLSVATSLPWFAAHHASQSSTCNFCPLKTLKLASMGDRRRREEVRVRHPAVVRVEQTGHPRVPVARAGRAEVDTPRGGKICVARFVGPADKMSAVAD